VRFPRRLGSVAGIELEAHWSLLLLLGWVVLQAVEAGHGGFALISGAFLLTAVGTSVVAHELGHALVARAFGVPTRRIVLSAIGGVAQLEGRLPGPRAELWIALAGPAVSLVLAAIFAATGWALDALPGLLPAVAGVFAGALATLNAMLGVFNLVPAFPMDGGRVLRAFLARRGDPLRATAIAVRVGRVLAALAAGWGLWQQHFALVVVAAFVWLSGTAELHAERRRAAAAHSFGAPWPRSGWRVVSFSVKTPRA
jgi:stage IV sporulation protein FB